MDKKVLIIDDDPDITESIKIILETRGFTIKTLHSFKDNKVVREFKPGLILLDFVLGGENGGDVVRTIRSYPDTKNIPIILLSAQPATLLKQVSDECGASGFMQKPFNIPDLIALVNTNFCPVENSSL